MLLSSFTADPLHRQDSQSLSSLRPTASTGSAGQTGTASDTLLDTLAKRIPGMSGAQELRQLDARNFTPEKVADRITGFVEQGLAQARRDGKSELEVENLRQQALAGINKGFDEARGILDEMQLLSDEMATTIDQTQALTLKGLEGLAPAATAPASRTEMLAAERYQSAESLSLKVRTQDGDQVTIRFDQASDYQASFGAYQGPEGQAASFSIDRSESSHYRFTVEGELDEAEIDALQKLIKDVNEIADEFFDGDIQSAFDQASEFQLDKSELASMNLRLTRSQSYSAVAAYQQVQEQGSGADGPGRKLGHLINDFAGRMNNPGLGFMAQPQAFGQELLEGLVAQDLRYKESDEEKRSRLDHNLETLRSLMDRSVLEQLVVEREGD